MNIKEKCKGAYDRAIELINKIGEENFPSPKIIEKLKTIGNSKDYSIYEIHHDYYNELINCKTLIF